MGTKVERFIKELLNANLQGADLQCADFTVMIQKQKTYTRQELENWIRFERVRQSGLYNMFDSNARLSTGLSKEEYTFVLRNYDSLGLVVSDMLQIRTYLVGR